MNKCKECGGDTKNLSFCSRSCSSKFNNRNPDRRHKKDTIKREDVEFAASKTKSMLSASKYLNIKFTSFKRYAEKYGLYKPNQAGVGISRNTLIPLNDIIFNNKYPNYSTLSLKVRLIKEGILQNTCNSCGITKWMNKNISLELHHKDGNNKNHNLVNLEILCPNCHSQTDTYKNRNRSSKKIITCSCGEIGSTRIT